MLHKFCRALYQDQTHTMLERFQVYIRKEPRNASSEKNSVKSRIVHRVSLIHL